MKYLVFIVCVVLTACGSLNPFDSNKTDVVSSELKPYPNPFDSYTEISYVVPENANIVIKIYDLFGKELFTLINEYKIKGEYKYSLNADELKSGIYIYKIYAGNNISSNKMVIIK